MPPKVWHVIQLSDVVDLNPGPYPALTCNGQNSPHRVEGFFGL